MEIASSITRKEVDDAVESKCGPFKESHSREDALLITRNLIAKAKSQMRTELISERREMYDGVQAWVDLKELLVDSQAGLEKGMKQRRMQSEKTAWEVTKLQQSVTENSAIAKASLANATMEAARAERAEAKCKSLHNRLTKENAQTAGLRQTVTDCVTRKWEWLAYIVYSRRMARNTRNDVLKAKMDECSGLEQSVKEGQVELQAQKKQVALVKTELASEKLEAQAGKQRRAEELRAHEQQISALKKRHEASKVPPCSLGVLQTARLPEHTTPSPLTLRPRVKCHASIE
ncbi:hypothetical protein CYMTET_32820 [Cymbomonas tetramitiformis]|uniref:Uncharacterized protein n=1 Tax=Cymbomonas tetramitiformis TaxID=36881 RepID=A0AAE0KRG8_9CHLO|nr:hypothetical protein CYMTET_32820 [Cymbomonas tetramitiformis]